MDNALIELICAALRFSVWGAGEGLSPADGPEGPEDFLYRYSLTTGEEDWEALPERVAAALKEAGHNPSLAEALNSGDGTYRP